MYLSYLLIDLGDNPDRPRPGRLWLRNVYHVHQRLCMAFPSDSRKADDMDFIKPFNPEDFGCGQVHVSRKSDSGFLYRIDPHSGNRAVILVQSAVKPDWDYAFHNADYLLAASPEVKPFEPSWEKGEHLRFRLMANPTKRLSRQSLEPDGNLVKKESVGKRVPVREDQLLEWLIGRSESLGFSVEAGSVLIQPGYIYMGKSGTGAGNRLRSVRYDGVLKVKNAEALRKTISSGIGSGKAFGFGLLSVAPIRGSYSLEAT